MPIPNVPTLFQKIHGGSEGGLEFARGMKLLLYSDFRQQGAGFVSESDASGDYKGLDAYITSSRLPEDIITGFQFKFYPARLSSKQKVNIIQSIEKAFAANPDLENFILLTPEDFHKEQQIWFNGIKSKFEKPKFTFIDNFPYYLKPKVHHWGHTKIIDLVLRNEEVGRRLFPELFPHKIGSFKLAYAEIDSKASSWDFYRGITNTARFVEDNSRISDPIFDFQFKNSTDEIYILQKIELHIEDIWTELKGFPQRMLLKSSGFLEHSLDYSLSINEISIPHPIVFKKDKAERFKIQIKNIENCPGNMLKLKFLFHFDETSFSTNSCILSFQTPLK